MSLALAAAALATAAAVAIPDTAHAQVQVRVGGSVTVGGSVHVGWRSTRRLRRIHRPRPVNVYYYYPTYSDPPPPPQPESCCQCAESCAPAPAPAYYAPAYAAPPAVYAQSYEREPRFGIGIRASSLVLERDGDEDGVPADGVGLLLRMRLRSNLELELDIGHDKFQELEREDTRIGGALYLPLTRGRLAPYLVVGAGVNAIQMYQDADPIQQGYLEAGGGLAWKISPRFVISGDLRWSARKEMRDDEDAVIQASTSTGGATTTVSPFDRERGVEGRISGILYF